MSNQDEADRLLGASIRKMLNDQRRELYPHAAESWHARLTLRRHDPGHDGITEVSFRCHDGDDMCEAFPTLDEAVAVVLSGKYKHV